MDYSFIYSAVVYRDSSTRRSSKGFRIQWVLYAVVHWSDLSTPRESTAVRQHRNIYGVSLQRGLLRKYIFVAVLYGGAPSAGSTMSRPFYYGLFTPDFSTAPR